MPGGRIRFRGGWVGGCLDQLRIGLPDLGEGSLLALCRGRCALRLDGLDLLGRLRPLLAQLVHLLVQLVLHLLQGGLIARHRGATLDVALAYLAQRGGVQQGGVDRPRREGLVGRGV